MGLFSNKKKSDSNLKILNEKEIQQKLYGHYNLPKTSVGSDSDFSESTPTVANSKTNIASSRLTDEAGSQTETKSGTIQNHLNTSEKTQLSKKATDDSFNFKTNTKSENLRTQPNSLSYQPENAPQRSIAFIGDIKLAAFALIGILILGGVLYGAIHLKHRRENLSKELSVISVNNKIEEAKTVAPVKENRTAPSKAVLIEQAAKLEVDKSEPIQEIKVEARETIKPSASETQKYYAIQICTYRSEADAEHLTARLSDLKLPAHYVSVPGKQNEKGKFYLVLVGKDATYADAQARLAKFKQMPVWNEFPDAYIRRNA